ncbi:MAG: hypothetical protein A2Y58_03265 [Chloroflexi bacterium RBG_13_51_52]|nr:MAG: hypothetical protein A2Y58_03265 [Chloroflexi bacterium RBG_13_51_52]
MIDSQLMYCPSCDVQLIIKNTDNFDLSKCPFCREALLIPASKTVIESLKNLRGIIRNIEYQNDSITVVRKFEILQPYKNTDNFDLSNRMN